MCVNEYSILKYANETTCHKYTLFFYEMQMHSTIYGNDTACNGNHVCPEVTNYGEEYK